MDTGVTSRVAPATLATERPARSHLRVASGLCLAATLAAILIMPEAARRGPAAPGFLLIDQTALIIAYGLSAWVLFVQAQRARTLPILLMAGGTLYTALMVTFQLLSFPGTAAAGRVLGDGPETTTWLWTFWHFGPPSCALAYALALRDGRHRTRPLGRRNAAVVLTSIAACAAAATTLLIVTAGLPWLPHQVTGDDYSDVTRSGIGPMLQVLTIAALVAVWRATRRQQSVLDLWIAVSLVLLILDNFLTMAGGARASIGWFAGRIEALVSAFAILWAYLHEVDALRGRAETAMADAARAGAALRQAQKMEAIGRLTGGIAHDFNNLLTVVTSGFDMIRRRPGDQARVIKMADAGMEAALRGSRLTRQLLTFARRQNLRMETVNLNASLLDFEPLGHRALGEAAEMHLHLDPALHPASIDGSEFEAAVLNLIVNARDAAPARGGVISITTRNAHRAAGVQDAPEALPAGAYAVVSIADNGSGMEPATLAQAFEPFFTTKEFGKGSGLGLSQVYGFARSAGGMVEIVSAAGQGTTVEIWLPRAESVQAASAHKAQPAPFLRHAEAGETILAVEDEPAVLSAVVETLTDLGYGVLPARDAREALDRLASGDRVDLLFTDVVMPGGMNGVQLAAEAKRLRPELRVLLTSGYTHEALSGQHKIPVDLQILTKPYRQAELADRIRAAWQPREAGRTRSA